VVAAVVTSLATFYVTEVSEKWIELTELLEKVNKRAAKSADFSYPSLPHEGFDVAVYDA